MSRRSVSQNKYVAVIFSTFTECQKNGHCRFGDLAKEGGITPDIARFMVDAGMTRRDGHKTFWVGPPPTVEGCIEVHAKRAEYVREGKKEKATAPANQAPTVDQIADAVMARLVEYMES